ncbi:MAG TPA: phosphate-starvation-inducible PsiE family protein [Casimicrobiaceae bacterium]
MDTQRNARLTAIQAVGSFLVDAFHYIALFVIGGSIVWSAVVSYLSIMQKGFARLDDLLLLFIYLELGTMIGIYFKTSRLPVRFLVYVAITALTRYLTVDVKDLPVNGLLAVAGAILMLALSALALDYGIAKTGNEPDQ